MTDYEIQEQAATYTIPDVTIDHVTADNFSDKVADMSLEEVKDVNGNVIGYYKDSVMSVTEPGQFSTSKKVQVFLVPEVDASSTPDNVIVNFKAMERQPGEKPHGFTHPQTALENAKAHFDVDKREEDMIVKHMWPLTVKLPKYAESYVIVAIDKYSAMLEISMHLGSVMKKKARKITHRKAS